MVHWVNGACVVLIVNIFGTRFNSFIIIHSATQSVFLKCGLCECVGGGVAVKSCLLVSKYLNNLCFDWTYYTKIAGRYFHSKIAFIKGQCVCNLLCSAGENMPLFYLN